LCRQVSELITSRQFCRIGLDQPHQMLARNLAAATIRKFRRLLESKRLLEFKRADRSLQVGAQPLAEPRCHGLTAHRAKGVIAFGNALHRTGDNR
jgi:hypothetical protein